MVIFNSYVKLPEGSIDFSERNMNLPAMLGFTRYQGLDP